MTEHTEATALRDTEVVAALERVVAAVAASVGPAVVGIGRGGGRGSGVVIDEGRVLTNAHNLRGRQVTVHVAGGRSSVGTVVGVDVDGDLAVVDVDTDGVPPIPWSERPLATGAAVVAVANPSGRALRTTLGFVSAIDRAFRGPRGRRISGSVEHTAPLASGSSGGPIVDVTGALVGLNTHRLGDGFYLALPADADLRARVDALLRGEAPTRRGLGVGVAPAEVARQLRRSVGLPERDGLLVRTVDEQGPAARAGVRVGDLLVAAGDRPLGAVDDLLEVLEGVGDDALVLRLVRGADELDVAVTFGAGEAPREEGAA